LLLLTVFLVLYQDFVCVCVCDTGVWTQGLTLAKQALLLLQPLHQPFFVMDIFSR
jgi:hypothetical protein